MMMKGSIWIHWSTFLIEEAQQTSDALVFLSDFFFQMAQIKGTQKPVFDGAIIARHTDPKRFLQALLLIQIVEKWRFVTFVCFETLLNIKNRVISYSWQD
jgi:hypothetical protein